MNYDKPRQKKDGSWGYTSMNDRDKYPHGIGYCAPYRELPEETAVMLYGSGERYEQESAPYREADKAGKFHDGGHATPEEACECYKQYLLDFHLRFNEDRPDADSLDRCKVEGCESFTSGGADITGMCGPSWPLCAEHRTRDVVSGLLTVGESWHS